LLYGPDSTVVAESEKILRGVIKESDTGKGRPGIVVHMSRDSNGLLFLPLQTRTDTQGRYEIRGAHKARRYMIEVPSDSTAGYMDAHTWADDTPGYQPVRADITVKKGVIVTGKVIDKATGKPIPGFAMVSVLQNNPFVKDFPPFNFPNINIMVNVEGTFRVVTIPGHVLLMGGASDGWSRFKPLAPDPKYPQYFTGSLDYPAYHNPDGSMSLVQGNYCKVLDIKPDAKIVEQDIVLERASALPVRIQDAEGKPLTNVWVAGSNAHDIYPAIQCKEAECSAYQIEAGKPRLLVFYHPGRKLAGTLTLKGDEKPPVVARLGQAGALRGQLLDADGNPLAGIEVDVHYRQHVASKVHNVIRQGKQVVTDANGVFTLDDVIAQQQLELSFGQGKRKFERTPKPANSAIEVKSGESRDVGVIKLKRIVEQPGE
jgi:hypothetical protein